MDYENSTAQIEQSGEQAEAVAPQDENRLEDSSAGRESVVATRKSDFDLVEMDNGAEGTTEPEDSKTEKAEQVTENPEVTAKPEQSREENAAIRAARLRARREAEAEAQKAADKRFAKAGIANPLTGKPFESLKEWEDYAEAIKREKRAEEAKKTGKSVEELEEDEKNRAFLTRMRKKEEAEQEQSKRKEFLLQDALDFAEKYPQIGINGVTKLEQDKKFRQFCGSRFGHEPLATLYADYISLVGDAGKTAVAKEQQRAARSTGSGAAGGVILSPSQKAALDAWNAEHPEMAMTAKEFLGR